MTGQTLRVRVVVSVTIDRDAWAEEFGQDRTDESARSIRETVRGEVISAAESAFAYHPSVTVGTVPE